MHSFKLESYGISDIGLVRQNNEDVWCILPELSFFALADGMGGHNAGEIAAREAISQLCKILTEKMKTYDTGPSAERIASDLGQSIREANAWVYKMSGTDEELRGMGTTLCCFLLADRQLIHAHIGDSRIYHYNGRLSQLTLDHSLRSELIASGRLDEQTAPMFAFKNVITRAVGTSAQVEPEIGIHPVNADDIFFLCSDGLTDHVSSREMQAIIQQSESIQEAADTLVNTAKIKGGNDNISIVIVKVFV